MEVPGGQQDQGGDGGGPAGQAADPQAAHQYSSTTGASRGTGASASRATTPGPPANQRRHRSDPE